MKTRLIAAIAILAVTTIAQAAVGFFKTDVVQATPFTRGCTLQITWVLGRPNVVAITYAASSTFSQGACEEQKIAATSAALAVMQAGN